VTIQDHGGGWHAHGSFNVNRSWNMGLSDYVMSGIREDDLREKKEPEPICCPRCFFIRLSGDMCPSCKYRHETRSRLVVQHTGILKPVEGAIYKPRREYRSPGCCKEVEELLPQSSQGGHDFQSSA
jgi:hypothetical protein